MSDSRETHINRLLGDADDVVRRLSHLDELHIDSDSNVDTSVRREAVARFKQANSDNDDFPMDGFVDISVSDDEMTAYADFFPPTDGMRPIAPDDVAAQLADLEVHHGVRWDEISEAVQQCNLDRQEIVSVVVARGDTPTADIPEYLLIEPEFVAENDTPSQRSDGSVDFRSVTPFRLVDEGTVLARTIPSQPGAEGMTVRGRPVPYVREPVRSYVPGENTRLVEGELRATRQGKVDIVDYVIQVAEVLVLAGDVDYHTGHIDFPGDVFIRGQIKDGFRVHSGRSIYCEDTMDASDVVAGGDLTVKRGLIGRGSASVKVEGTVRAKFIENCYVEASAGVLIEAGIISSHIYTHGVVNLGGRGVLVGGLIYAQNGLTANQIGSDTGPRTQVFCGVDYAAEQKLDWIRDQTVKIASKLREVRAARERTAGPELAAMEEKLESALRRMNEAAGNLLFDIDKNDEATVSVRGKVYPGTYIEICHVSYVVHRPENGVRFRLLKNEGRIVSEALSNRGI